MKPQHEQFIREFLKTGDQITSYQKVYKVKSRKIASNGAKQLMKFKDVAATIKHYQQRDKAIYEKAREELIAKQAAEDVASEHEIKSILTKIVRKKGVQDPKQKIMFPSFQEQIHAAKTLNEMCGYEAPKEIDVTSGGNSLVPITEVKIVHSKKNED